jgi:hypothetical protein
MSETKNCMSIEVKVCVTANTSSQERAFLHKRISADASEICEAIPRDHESFQLLHFVYRYPLYVYV